MSITAAEPTHTLDDLVEEVVANLNVDDLFRAVVTEMNCIYPANALQNDRLEVLASPSTLRVNHPEWGYVDTQYTYPSAPRLGDALRAILAALHSGRLVPVNAEYDEL